MRGSAAAASAGSSSSSTCTAGPSDFAMGALTGSTPRSTGRTEKLFFFFLRFLVFPVFLRLFFEFLLQTELKAPFCIGSAAPAALASRETSRLRAYGHVRLAGRPGPVGTGPAKSSDPERRSQIELIGTFYQAKSGISACARSVGFSAMSQVSVERLSSVQLTRILIRSSCGHKIFCFRTTKFRAPVLFSALAPPSGCCGRHSQRGPRICSKASLATHIFRGTHTLTWPGEWGGPVMD